MVHDDSTTGLLLPRLRRVLVDAGFTTERIAHAAVFPSTPRADPVQAAMERIDLGPGLGTMLRLFVAGGTVTPAEATEAFAPIGIHELVESGLLEHQRGAVRSTVALEPFGDHLFAFDFRARRADYAQAGGEILGIGGATRQLAGLTVRRGGETALDLGSGQGFQAVLAANHAHRVIATDINPRALRACSLSAALNGADVECRQGSLFDSVNELRGGFNLIVSNLPFVIMPRSDVVALGGGAEENSLVERAIRGTPAFLADDGFACLLGSWGHRDDSDWMSLPREWTSGSGCDVLMIRTRSQDPRQYAVQWIDESEGIAGCGSVPPLPVWLDYFAQLGIGRFTMGAAIIRRRSGGTNWFAAESLLEQKPPEAGEQLLRIFRSRTLLAGLCAADQILDTPLVLTDAHELVEHRRLRGGRWGSYQMRLRQTDGFEFPIEIDQPIAELIAAFDGVKSPRRILAEATRLRRADASKATAQGLAFIRRMLEIGYLIPATSPGSPSAAGDEQSGKPPRS